MAARTSTEQQLPHAIPQSETATTGSAATQRLPRDARVAGVLLSLAGAAILMGFITAEALYPGVYTTHTNTVSHWAPPSRPTVSCCSPRRPSSTSRCWSPGP